MDILINWIVATDAGNLVARGALLLIGAGIWSNLMLLASYVPREAVPIRVAILIVLGVGAGAGAVHAALWGHLLHGAVYASAASGLVLALLLSVVGTPKEVSQIYDAPIDRGRWLADSSLVRLVSDWGDLSARQSSKSKNRGER